jgi:cbb3-type cytochrome oxidase maturation protein
MTLTGSDGYPKTISFEPGQKKRCGAMTLWTLVLLIFGALMLGTAAWLIFIWAVKSGQFDDMEGPKYRIFDEDDDAPPPAANRDQ